MPATGLQHSRRERNPRGQGERLREDIIEAASALLADPAAPPLSLRGVARAVGVAATSVYLHFADVDELVRAVADRHFGELARVTAQASGHLAGPCERVQAHALAYCEFGLAHPGQYQVMFSSPLPLVRGEDGVRNRVPVRPAFEKLAEATAECLGCQPGDQEAAAAATLIWQQLHGAVSLRITRPYFPWPPLAGQVADAVGSLLAGARERVSDRDRDHSRQRAAGNPSEGADR